MLPGFIISDAINTALSFERARLFYVSGNAKIKGQYAPLFASFIKKRREKTCLRGLGVIKLYKAVLLTAGMGKMRCGSVAAIKQAVG